jgi:hypothetical protein
MWSDGRWNKLTMAHGCYWGKCTFCDISLDYKPMNLLRHLRGSNGEMIAQTARMDVAAH